MMKLLLIAIAVMLAAAWFGTWCGHLADRNIKPIRIKEELIQ